ncbi:MAG: hypothetical protein QM747_01985 [Nocardioides sp.]
MLTLSSLRRAGALAAASALTVSLVSAGAAQAAPADRSADWLSGQLTGGLMHNPNFGGFDDYGLSIDTAFALQAVGGHRADTRQIRNAIAANIDGYITGDSFGDPGSHYAGATAKALVLAQNTGGKPTDFGGVNLVKQLTSLVTKKGSTAGRIADVTTFSDSANTLGQILAVRGLTAAKSGQAGKARAFLLQQQCRQGYFRLNFSKPKAVHQGCRATSPADPDATSYAVIELWKASKDNHKLRSALERAVAWLGKQQRKNGSFLGGTSTASPNTNSTGLAGWALGLTGSCHAAKQAAHWVAGFQVGADSGAMLSGQRGAIAYDKAGLRAGKKDGITTETQDQWRRATSQAAPVLTFRSGC